ncbi:hypothetical protein N7462_007782 [Penicillium macrosclerotiorum]|uniref:uncharacterized protein n=1 Tax=Penicillium macrosclerotiorum TaxID=303699 RepID=UPI0025478275|nr:uncharacterized protein N7462_007782 [Penicillium macrosclerotiorum]KAJ5679538.1 hypothetical protein N7462_007782 [Penicillium macrosclerotiorum]
MVAPLLERLEHVGYNKVNSIVVFLTVSLQNVYNVFPMPKASPRAYDAQPFLQPSEASMALPESSNKENAAPGGPQTPSHQQSTIGSSTSSERVPESQPQPSSQQTSDTLPPPLVLLLNSIRSAIQTLFVRKPPHTIQRLAELILRPTAHYRTLPAYLRAVDRVVSVTSGADIFPFNSPATTGTQPNGLMHPTNSAGTYLTPDYSSGLGSDESLGGALLTPIPWLTNVSFESESGGALQEVAPSQEQGIDTGATLAMEGQEAEAGSSSPPTDTSDEVPHARGPPVVGVEDLGLQDGKDLEVKLDEQGAKDGTTGSSSTDAPQPNDETHSADQDGDIILDDSKPKEEINVEDTTAAAPQTGEGRSESAGDSTPATKAE